MYWQTSCSDHRKNEKKIFLDGKKGSLPREKI